MLIYILVIISLILGIRATLELKVKGQYVKALAVNQKAITRALNRLVKDLEKKQ